MIRKKPAPHLMRGGYRFSEKIMLKQKDRAGGRLEEKSSRSSGGTIAEHSPRVHMKLMQAREITPHVWAHPDEDRRARPFIRGL